MKLPKLTHKQKTALMIGGGLVLLSGGVVLLMSGTKPSPAPPEKLTPGPSPDPSLPPPAPSMKSSYYTTYRGVHAQVGTNLDDEWICIYSINGELHGIGPVRTNESGILTRFNKQVDDYYATARWYPLSTADGVTLSDGGVYRFSIPSDQTNAIAFPNIHGGKYNFDELPEDWPATDRDDPNRVRIWLRAEGSTKLPYVDGMLAWVLGKAQQAQS